MSTIVIMIAILSGCKKEKQPTACFTTSNTNIETGQSVSFTNCSTDGHSGYYKWDFGDGEGSTANEPPSHTYNTAGTYDVKLTAYSKSEKKSNTATATITVIDPIKTGPMTATTPGYPMWTSGNSYGNNTSAIYSNPVIDIIGSNSNLSSIKLHIVNFTGTTGTFKLGGSGVAGYGQWWSNFYDGWQTNLTDSGTVTITKFDPVAKNVSGTFNFFAYQTYSQWGPPIICPTTISVTNGSFSDVIYE